MPQPAETRAVYEDLYSVPDNMTGEIIGGKLVVTPRPSRRHGYAAFSLGGRLTPFFQFTDGRQVGSDRSLRRKR